MSNLELQCVHPKNNLKITYLVLEEINSYRSKIVLSNGRVTIVGTSELDEVFEGDETIVSGAQIEAFHQFHKNEQALLEKRASFLAKRSELLADTREELDKDIHSGELKLRYLAGFAKEKGLLTPRQRQFLFQVGLRTKKKLTDDEAEGLLLILRVVHRYFSENKVA